MNNRNGRFEIVIRDVVRKEGRRVTKTGTSWHIRWRADGNLRMVASGELLTSKRNAEKAVVAMPGVRVLGVNEVIMVDGSFREVRMVDERDPKLVTA